MLTRREFLTSAAALPFVSPGTSARQAAAARSVAGRLGASTACLAGFTLIDAIRRIHALGFGTIEMIAYTGARHSVGDIPGFSFRDASPAERERVFAATRPFQHISAHLPFQDVRLFSSKPGEAEASLARLHDAIDGLAYLRGEFGVLHVGWPDKGLTFRDIWQPMVNTLRGLGDHAARRQLRIGIETMQPDSVRDYSELVVAVNHPNVGAVIDTGHIRGSTDIGLPPDRRDTDDARARFNDVLNSLTERLGPKVLHVHLSDVTRAEWTDHRTIGSGIIDFPRFFQTLRAIEYQRLLVLELEEKAQIEALTRSKAYAEELMVS